MTAALRALFATLLFGVLVTSNAAGYRFGISDQSFYVPAIERAIDHITGIRQRRRELTVEIRIVLNNEQAQAGLQW